MKLKTWDVIVFFWLGLSSIPKLHIYLESVHQNSMEVEDDVQFHMHANRVNLLTYTHIYKYMYVSTLEHIHTHAQKYSITI